MEAVHPFTWRRTRVSCRFTRELVCEGALGIHYVVKCIVASWGKLPGTPRAMGPSSSNLLTAYLFFFLSCYAGVFLVENLILFFAWSAFFFYFFPRPSSIPPWSGGFEGWLVVPALTCRVRRGIWGILNHRGELYCLSRRERHYDPVFGVLSRGILCIDYVWPVMSWTRIHIYNFSPFLDIYIYI